MQCALSGNLCRCTGYDRIVKAVGKAADAGYSPNKTACAPRVEPDFSATEKDCFFSPASLSEALDILDRRPDILLLAGNTDIGPEMKSGKLQPHMAMDIFSIPELKKIELSGDAIHIGACVTNTEIMASDLIRKHIPALHQASSSCAAPAIRNRASVGGNLCTASGAADLPGSLFALGAKTRVVSKHGERIMEAPEFIKAYRQPNLEKGELLAEVIVPVPPANARQVFFKRGSRAALTLSRVSLALYVELTDGVISECRATAGSMSPTPIRLPKLEACLKGRKLDAVCIDCAVETIRNELTPRKSAQYRKTLAGNLVRRFLESLSA